MESPSYSENRATLPAIVDYRAQSTPDRLYGASCSIGDNGDLRVRRISYRLLSDSVNRCARWIIAKLGRSSEPTQIAYLGPSDYRYLIVTMAAAKTGHAALLLAPWNQKAAQLKLLAECDCTTVLVAEDNTSVQEAVQGWTSGDDLQIIPFPTLDSLLDGPEVAQVPFQQDLREVANKIYCVIHTSGSTGLPNPIRYTYGAMASLRWLSRTQEMLPAAPASNIEQVWSNRCHFMGLPACHMGGVLGLGPFNVYWNMPMLLGPSDRPVDPSIMASILSEDVCEAAFVPPAFLQALSRDREKLESVRGLKHCLWVGAPWTSAQTADDIRSRTRIEAAYGSSEAGPFAFILQHQDDYEWVQFHPIMGYELRPFTEELYELVLVKQANISQAQFVFHVFPDLDEWHTKDLFSRNPDGRDLWRYRGRTDDIIVLSTGRNIEPGGIESSLASHPKVRSALLCGSGHDATSLLVEAVEPPANDAEKEQLISDIWPAIEKGNACVASMGKITKDKIVFTRKDMPLARAGKGSVQRSLSVRMYQKELADVYHAA